MYWPDLEMSFFLGCLFESSGFSGDCWLLPAEGCTAFGAVPTYSPTLLIALPQLWEGSVWTWLVWDPWRWLLGAVGSQKCFSLPEGCDLP